MIDYRYPIGYLREVQAIYPIKVQVIRSKRQPVRYYVNIPLPLAAALDLSGGESVQWQLLSRSELRLLRLETPAPSARGKK